MRVLVFDLAESAATNHAPAVGTIGEKDFFSYSAGGGKNNYTFVTGMVVDEVNRWLFISDGPNNRVLVFDINRDKITMRPDAIYVLGQEDFDGRTPGSGKNKFMVPSALAIDPVHHRLFVGDIGNQRILVFDLSNGINNGMPAVGVIGQRDFESKEPLSPNDIRPVVPPSGIAYDQKFHRLICGDFNQHRIMVFDAHPDRLGEVCHHAELLAVLGQPNKENMEPVIAKNRVAFAKVGPNSIDSERQLVYVAEGFPGGNRIMIFDIHPDRLSDGQDAIKTIGPFTTRSLRGDAEFRAPNGRINDYSVAAPRGCNLDSKNHRLFVADSHNHRVVVWQLDKYNRPLNRKFVAVLGQPDPYSCYLRELSRETIKLPLAMCFDHRHDRLFVIDGWSNRVLVFDAHPERLGNGMLPSYVIGQSDFTSSDGRCTADGLSFDIRGGRGFASTFNPIGVTVDEDNERLFISDGANNRILIYDVTPTQMQNGMEAIAVLGQDDFVSRKPGSGKNKLIDPGDLAYDPEYKRLFAVDANNHRVSIYDVDPERVENGADAIGMLGNRDIEEMDAEASLVLGHNPYLMRAPKEPSAELMRFTTGVAHSRSEQRLFILDNQFHRILIFDVHPEALSKSVAAIDVLGQDDLSSLFYYAPGPVNADSRLSDPRGIAYDETYGHLFMTDSHWARIMVYRDARVSEKFELSPNATFRGFTTDARKGSCPQQSGYGKAQDDTSLALSTITMATKIVVESQSSLESRELLGQAALSSSQGAKQYAIYIDDDASHQTELSLLSEGGSASVRFSGSAPEATAKLLSIESGKMLQGTPTALEVTDGLSTPGLLHIDSDLEISVNGLRHWTSEGNTRGPLSAVPVWEVGQKPSGPCVLPRVVDGGGYQSRILVFNDSNEAGSGLLKWLDPDGAVVHDIQFDIDANGLWVWDSPATSHIERAGYAVVVGEKTSLQAKALVRRQDGESCLDETLISEHHTDHALVAVDNRRSMIRHGRIRTLVTIAAITEQQPADIRLALIDPDGSHCGERCVIVPATHQVEFTLEDLFDTSLFTGTLRLLADTLITVSVRMEVVTVGNNRIVTELPINTEPSKILMPIINGAGLATEVIAINIPNSDDDKDETEIETSIDFKTLDGEDWEIQLR